MKRLYGVPVAVENIALVVNTKLAKVPKTFAHLENAGLAVKKKNGSLRHRVQQGTAGDAYHMYPFFSGLCGYVFGTNKAGNLDPSDIGVASPAFLKNATLIDSWNKKGLINSKIDYATCDTPSLKSEAPFWITGPWDVADIKKAGIKFKVVQMPPIRKASVPFLGVHGFMVTKFASAHGVDAAAKDLVGNYFDAAGADRARRGGRPAPANTQGEGDRPDPGPVRRGRQGRRPDAEHPADGQRLERSRPGVGQGDEGLGRDAGAGAPSSAPPGDRDEDRLADPDRSGRPRAPAPFRAPRHVSSATSTVIASRGHRCFKRGADLAGGRRLLRHHGLRDQDRAARALERDGAPGPLRPRLARPLAALSSS